VVAASKDGSFDNFLETGGELTTVEPSISSHMDKLIKTKAQYQELLNSGKIKDERRKETIVQNIIDIDKQIAQVSPDKTVKDVFDPKSVGVGILASPTKLKTFPIANKKKRVPRKLTVA
jgi:hypothetical protein